MSWLAEVAPTPTIVGAVGPSPHWHDARRMLADHELMLCGPGARYEFRHDHGVIRLAPQSWIIVPPGAWHICSFTGASTRRAWVHYDWQPGPPPRDPVCVYAPDIPAPGWLRPPPPGIPAGWRHGALSDPASAWSLFDRLDARFHHGDVRVNATARALLLELLLALLADEAPPAAPRLRRPQLVERIRAELATIAATPFARQPALRRRLASFGCTYDHAARSFRAAFGMTPLDYIASQRLAAAETLLADTTLTVREIAGRLGFNDHAYFGRLFRRHRGHTPQAWRKKRGKT